MSRENLLAQDIHDKAVNYIEDVYGLEYMSGSEFIELYNEIFQQIEEDY